MRPATIATLSLTIVVLALGPMAAEALGQFGTRSTQPAFPQKMEVSGEAVNVRSGPGEYFYRLGRLSEPTVVTALGEANGWYGVEPPVDVEALVRKSDVRRGDTESGLVTATMARVYAADPGSARRWAVIAQLPIDSQVTILGETGDYFRISTPDEARVYVNGSYLRRRGEGGTEDTQQTGNGEETTGTVDIEVKQFNIDPQAEVYDGAVEQLGEELQRPLRERDFRQIEQKLSTVKAEAEAPYLKQEAERLLGVITFQRELQAGIERLQEDRQTLQRQLSEIERQTQERTVEESGEETAENVATPDAEGVLKRMAAVSKYPYRLEGADGRFVCLLRSAGPDLSAYVGETVRVWGHTERLPEWGDMEACEVMRIETAD